MMKLGRRSRYWEVLLSKEGDGVRRMSIAIEVKGYFFDWYLIMDISAWRVKPSSGKSLSIRHPKAPKVQVEPHLQTLLSSDFSKTKATLIFTWSKILVAHQDSTTPTCFWLMRQEIGHRFQGGKWMDCGRVKAFMPRRHSAGGKSSSWTPSKNDQTTTMEEDY